MGISGLLPFIKPVTKTCHIKEFSGSTLAIDSFILLHKASLIHGEFEEASGKQKLLSYLQKWLDMFEHFDIIPFFVLDGSQLKSKEVTNEARRKARDALKETAEKLRAKGRHTEANEALRKSRGVTPIMIEIFLNLLKERNVQFVVAPFEADAQLAYLAKQNLCKGVVTEDSDLLVFGCPLVIFKLDPLGNCDKVLGNDLFLKKSSPFYGMNLEKMREICILSGCDYLPNIPSLGLKTSYKLYQELETLEKVREFIESKPKYKIPENYWLDFKMANDTFLYQKIYCPTDKIIKNLNFLKEEEDCIDYLKLSESVEELDNFNKIIRGECCPKTLLPYNFLPTKVPEILKPSENSLLRVTSSVSSVSTKTPNTLPKGQTLLNQYLLAEIKTSSNNKESDNLISNLYKLKKKDNNSDGGNNREIKKIPIKLVSPFFNNKSNGNNTNLIKLTTQTSTNNNEPTIISDDDGVIEDDDDDITLIESESATNNTVNTNKEEMELISSLKGEEDNNSINNGGSKVELINLIDNNEGSNNKTINSISINKIVGFNNNNSVINIRGGSIKRSIDEVEEIDEIEEIED